MDSIARYRAASAEDGLIRRIRPHLRPWLALTLLAIRLGPKVGRRPGVVWRALRAPDPDGNTITVGELLGTGN